MKNRFAQALCVFLLSGSAVAADSSGNILSASDLAQIDSIKISELNTHMPINVYFKIPIFVLKGRNTRTYTNGHQFSCGLTFRNADTTRNRILKMNPQTPHRVLKVVLHDDPKAINFELSHRDIAAIGCEYHGRWGVGDAIWGDLKTELRSFLNVELGTPTVTIEEASSLPPAPGGPRS